LQSTGQKLNALHLPLRSQNSTQKTENSKILVVQWFSGSVEWWCTFGGYNY